MTLPRRSRLLRRTKLLAVFAAFGVILACFVIWTRDAAADGAQTEAILRALETDPLDGPPTADARARARAAIARATRHREAGDEARARLADGLALRIAELARDQARTARLERATEAALRGAQDAGAMVERERALAEEALAQSGRLRAQLEALAVEKKREPDRTATRVLADAGTQKPPAAPPPRAARDGGAP